MKKVGIIYNAEKSKAKLVLANLKHWFKKKNCHVFAIPSTLNKIPNMDLALALGGDGTMLRAGCLLAEKGIPVLGVNLGSLGFLAETNVDEGYIFAEKLLSSKFEVEERMLLNVVINRKGKKVRKYALNECIIRSGSSGRVINVEASVNNEFLADYIGDGLIVSTPTGSTAYSLAASGPIVHPDLSVFVITPICPHTLTQRPMIISTKNTKVTMKVKVKKNQEKPIVAIDGQIDYVLSENDSVSITVADKKLKLIVNPERKYFEVLRAKLKWGERG